MRTRQQYMKIVRPVNMKIQSYVHDNLAELLRFSLQSGLSMACIMCTGKIVCVHVCVRVCMNVCAGIAHRSYGKEKSVRLDDK